MNSGKIALIAVLVLACAVFAPQAMAEEGVLKPYVLASNGPGSIDNTVEGVRASLVREGFEVAGEYSPYKGSHVIIVTSDALKIIASKSEFGAYGAAQRISLTESGSNLQVAYTNPRYFAQAYRMKDSLSDVADALARALGNKEEFGSKEGLSANSLRKYHYMVMMPYFTDHIKLASYGSQEQAINAVEHALGSAKSGASKVYRVDLKGKKESVFGVGINTGDGADATIMKVVDIHEPRHTAHLPYEMIVSDGSVYMLHGKFRIALSFPDLTMGTFMKISGAPSAIEDVLEAVAGGK